MSCGTTLQAQKTLTSTQQLLGAVVNTGLSAVWAIFFAESCRSSNCGWAYKSSVSEILF